MLGRSIGLTYDELAAIANWEESTLFDEKDRAVLSYTDSLSEHNTVSDETYNNLNHYFTESQIVKTPRGVRQQPAIAATAIASKDCGFVPVSLSFTAARANSNTRTIASPISVPLTRSPLRNLRITLSSPSTGPGSA